MEVLVKIAHIKHGIQLHHYGTLDAPTIVETILDVLKEDLIDYPKKMLGGMSDGCNTMEGRHNGVKKRLADVIPQFADMGSCNSHHIGTAFEYGVKNFDNDSQEALVNIYFDFGGAKGKGLKRKKQFEKVALDKGITPAQFKKVCTTRFRSFRIVLKPVLSNWHAIVAYYRTAKKLTDR